MDQVTLVIEVVGNMVTRITITGGVGISSSITIEATTTTVISEVNQEVIEEIGLAIPEVEDVEVKEEATKTDITTKMKASSTKVATKITDKSTKCIAGVEVDTITGAAMATVEAMTTLTITKSHIRVEEPITTTSINRTILILSLGTLKDHSLEMATIKCNGKNRLD